MTSKMTAERWENEYDIALADMRADFPNVNEGQLEVEAEAYMKSTFGPKPKSEVDYETCPGCGATDENGICDCRDMCGCRLIERCNGRCMV